MLAAQCYSEHVWVKHLLRLADAGRPTLASRSIMAGADIEEPIVAPLPRVRKSAIPNLHGADFPLDEPRRYGAAS